MIDEGWFFFNPEARPPPDTLVYAIDGNGRYVPVPHRFSSARSGCTRSRLRRPRRRALSLPVAPATPAPHDAKLLLCGTEFTSFKALGDWVHAQGLKFGILIPCARDSARLRAAESSDRQQFVSRYGCGRQGRCVSVGPDELGREG